MQALIPPAPIVPAAHCIAIKTEDEDEGSDWKLVKQENANRLTLSCSGRGCPFKLIAAPPRSKRKSYDEDEQPCEIVFVRWEHRCRPGSTFMQKAAARNQSIHENQESDSDDDKLLISPKLPEPQAGTSFADQVCWAPALSATAPHISFLGRG